MVGTDAKQVKCKKCGVMRAELQTGQWCSTCGYNPEYEEKLQKAELSLKVMNEKSLDGYEFMVDCSGYVANHPNDQEVKNLLFEIRKLINENEKLKIDLIFQDTPASDRPEHHVCPVAYHSDSWYEGDSCVWCGAGHPNEPTEAEIEAWGRSIESRKEII